MPGSSTWAASSRAWTLATRTPAARTCWDLARNRPRNVSSPPMPRSTRRPATVSAPRVVSSPTRRRCSVCRRLSGRSSGATPSASSGTPSSTSSPRKRRGVQQDHGDHEERHHRAGGPGGHVEGAADAEDVRGGHAHDVAGRDLRGQRGAQPGSLPGHQLLGAERREQPVADGEAMAEDTGHGLQQADREQRERPVHKRGRVLRRDALVDRGPQDRRHERLPAHPQHAARDAAQQRQPLAAGHPPQVPGR